MVQSSSPRPLERSGSCRRYVLVPRTSPGPLALDGSAAPVVASASQVDRASAKESSSPKGARRAGSPTPLPSPRGHRIRGVYLGRPVPHGLRLMPKTTCSVAGAYT